jgi:hypothetical protein
MNITPRIKVMAAALAGLLFALSSATAMATNVRLVNYVAYTTSGNTADLATDGVQNMDMDDPTSSLRLELWAFSAPYTSGMSGTRLALYPMLPLDPGAANFNVDSGPVAYSPPGNGVWYYSMQLTEYAATSSNDGYTVRYWINMQDPVYIGVPPPPKKFRAIEFYHGVLDHYFVAASAEDVAALDTNMFPGWYRTGYEFAVWDGPAAGLSPVCRYYIPPGYGDSHFFSGWAFECSAVPTMFPYMFKESDAAFHIGLPDTSTGACASTEVPIYRLWNTRQDSNHRYTTSAQIKADMIAKGYVVEGYGPDQVNMCSPQ